MQTVINEGLMYLNIDTLTGLSQEANMPEVIEASLEELIMNYSVKSLSIADLI